MFFRFFFNQLSLQKQADYLKKKGIMLGTRNKAGRKLYLYMLNNLFAEVQYKNDNIEEHPEKLSILKGLKNLNEYLEKEFRASF